jgi:hypothetical protein
MEDIATTSERHEAGRTIMFWMDGLRLRTVPVILTPYSESPGANKQDFKVRADSLVFSLYGLLLSVFLILSLWAVYLVRTTASNSAVFYLCLGVCLLPLAVSGYLFFGKLYRVYALRNAGKAYRTTCPEVLGFDNNGTKSRPSYILLPDTFKADAYHDGALPTVERLVVNTPPIALRVDYRVLRRCSFLLEVCWAFAGTAQTYLFIGNQSAFPDHFGLFLLEYTVTLLALVWVDAYTTRLEKELTKLAKSLSSAKPR